jgi:hypothetical protein
MHPNINTLVNFFERMGIDDKNYFSLENSEKNKVCIYYQKNNSQKNWSIWYFKQEESTKKIFPAADLVSYLEEFKINEEEVFKQISSFILLQAAFADEFIRQATELLGPAAIQKSILQTQNFMTNLTELIGKLIPQEQSAADNEKHDIKQRLRIVK